MKRSIDASYTPYFAIRYPAQLVANRLLFRTTNVRRILPHLTNLSIKADGYHMLVNITKTLPVSLICHNIFFFWNGCKSTVCLLAEENKRQQKLAKKLAPLATDLPLTLDPLYIEENEKENRLETLLQKVYHHRLYENITAGS